MDKRIFLFGFLLFLFGTANAATLAGNFSLETDCFAPDKAVYILTNETGSRQTYEIRAVGMNKEWINLNGTWIGEEALTVSLGSGESKQLYAFVKPQTCYVIPGDYSITIEVSNGETISREIYVEVVESRVLQLEISPTRQETTQCKEERFEIRVGNTGEHGEKVLLSLEGMPTSWARLDTTEFFLDEGESRRVGLEINPACSAATREYGFSVKAALKGTAFFVEKNASLLIEDRQSIEITAQALQACAEKDTGSHIRIKNRGLLGDEVQLSIEGLGWAGLQPSQLTLEAGEEKLVSVDFSKTGFETGEYDFIVKAHSTKFNREDEKQLSVELLDCYNVSITSVLLDGLEAEEKPTACLESKPVYTFSLTNDAVETIKAEISVLGLDAVVSPATVSIGSGETKDVSVQLDLSQGQPGEKIFSLLLKGQNFSTQRDYTLVAEDCYNLEVEWDGLLKEIELDANCKSEPFTLGLRNKGSRSQSVSVGVSGPTWIYFEPQQLRIQPGEEQQVYLYFAPPYDIREGKSSATISVKGIEGAQSKGIEMMIYGGLYADLGTASVKTVAEVEEIIERTERTLKLSLQLSNDSNALIRVNSLRAKDFNAEFDFEETTLQPGETVNVPMQLYLGLGKETQFAVTLVIDTDKGTMERAVGIDLEESPEEQDFLVGLFGLADAELGDLLLAGIVIIVIVIFAALALKAETGKKPESGLKHLAEEVKEIPGKKLEEIGKRRKRGRKPSRRNLQDIVKQVKKRHVAKKKLVRKKAAKRKPARKKKK